LGGFVIKVHTIKLKQDNMLCSKCLLNVVRALSYIEGIQELDVNLVNKSVKVLYENERFSRQKIQKIVNESVIKGKVNSKSYQ